MAVTKPFKFVRFGDIHGLEPCDFTGSRGTFISHTPALDTENYSFVVLHISTIIICIRRSSIWCRSGDCSGWPGVLVPGPWGSIRARGGGSEGVRGRRTLYLFCIVAQTSAALSLDTLRVPSRSVNPTSNTTVFPEQLPETNQKRRDASAKIPGLRHREVFVIRSARAGDSTRGPPDRPRSNLVRFRLGRCLIIIV